MNSKATPLRKWKNANILSIFDHHVDVGAGPDADPRIFEKTASCTTLVARQMLDELEKLDSEYRKFTAGQHISSYTYERYALSLDLRLI